MMSTLKQAHYEVTSARDDVDIIKNLRLPGWRTYLEV